jgi:hypothetical protein
MTTSDTRLVAALKDFASSEAGAITDDYLASEIEVTRLERELAEARALRDGYAATWQRFWQHWNGPTEHVPSGEAPTW